MTIGWRIACVCLVVSCVLGCTSIAFAHDHWTRVQSAHFTVITDAHKASGTEVALRLENIRSAIGVLMPRARLDSGTPLQVIAVRNAGTLKALKPRREGKPVADAGMFIPRPDEAFILVDLSDANCWSAVFHEYAHAVLAANPSQNVGLWFEEGFSEYFSTLKVDKHQAEIGLPDMQAVDYLHAHHRLLTVKDIFRVTRDMPIYNQPSEYRSLFYAESWLIVHYLFDHGLLPSAMKFFASTSGEPSEDAIQAAFGLTTSQFDAALVEYIRGTQVRYFRRAINEPNADEFNVRELDRSESDALLEDARLHCRIDDSQGAVTGSLAEDRQ